MKRIQITNWKLEEGKIIFAGLDGEEIEMELPNDILKEIYVEGPPSEEKSIRELIEKIHEIRTKQILGIDDMAKEFRDNMKGQDDVQIRLKQASDKTKVLALGTEVRSIQAQKASIDALRHLSRLLYQEEGRLRAELLKLQRSNE